MPIPKPSPSEKEDDYVGRCMEAIGGEYDDEEQALAVCYSTFKESRKKEMNEQLLEAIRQRQAQKSEFGYGITTADRYTRNMLDAVGLEVAYKCAATRTVSWDDVMRKAARTLVYSNPDMITEEIEYSKRAGSSLKSLDGIELPKNCLMVFRHVLTTPRKDRDGDVLRTQGAKVDPRMILLWNHVHTLPIGKMLQVAEHNTKKLSLVSCIVDMNDLSHDCAVMIDNGMGRFSHGFRAIDFTKVKAEDGTKEAGFDVKDFEIMEESLVTVPSNTDAEVEEVMLGLVEGGKLTSPIMKEYGRSIRDHRPKHFAGGVDLAKISLPIDLKITLNGKEIETAEKGDAPGHPFRGNQHTGGGGGGDGGDSDESSAGESKREGYTSGAWAKDNPSNRIPIKVDEGIASKHLGISTLKEQRSDSLDFHGVGVSGVSSAFHESYKSGGGKRSREEMADTYDKVAKEHLRRDEGLAPRNMDSLDFFEVDVISVRDAINACYKYGKKGTKNADMSRDGGGSTEGAEREREERKDATGLAEKADDEGRDKAEEATPDAKIACPKCGEMMAKTEGAECPSCGYVLKKSDMEGGDEEDEGEEEPEEEKSIETETKSGRTISRGNLATLKEVHADVDELDRGEHVLSVKGRELCGRANKKLKGFIDSWDVDQAAEVPKSFSVEDAMAEVIASATPSQRQTIRKAFDAIEQVERANLQAKQYRALVAR